MKITKVPLLLRGNLHLLQGDGLAKEFGIQGILESLIGSGIRFNIHLHKVNHQSFELVQSCTLIQRRRIHKLVFSHHSGNLGDPIGASTSFTFAKTTGR